MRVLWSSLLAVALVAALGAGPVRAFLIDFDSLAPDAIIDGLDLGGVSVSAAPGSTRVMANGKLGAGWASPFNTVTTFNQAGFPDFLTTQPLTITFAVPQPSMSVTGGDSGGDFDQFTVTAFDSANNLLGVFVTPVFGGNPVDPQKMVDQYTVNLNFPGIKTVVVSNAINAGIGLDNIQFCVLPVPLPTTSLLLASGLLGLVGLRRRLK